MKPSCARLSAMIGNAKFTPQFLRERCEAYGRDVRCYIPCKDMLDRKTLESALSRLGCSVVPSYWPEGHTAEVKVAYFKARHWDE